MTFAVMLDLRSLILFLFLRGAPVMVFAANEGCT